MSSELRLVPRDRVVEVSDWGTQTPRRFLDFAVDGGSLYDQLVDLGMDYISPLWVDEDAEAQNVAAVERLLGEAPSDLPDNRVAVYGCPECFDLGCGAVTVRLTVSDQYVRWDSWAYQKDYDQTLDTSEVGHLPGLEFERSAYERSLRGWADLARPSNA